MYSTEPKKDGTKKLGPVTKIFSPVNKLASALASSRSSSRATRLIYQRSVSDVRISDDLRLKVVSGVTSQEFRVQGYPGRRLKSPFLLNLSTIMHTAREGHIESGLVCRGTCRSRRSPYRSFICPVHKIDFHQVPPRSSTCRNARSPYARVSHRH